MKEELLNAYTTISTCLAQSAELFSVCKLKIIVIIQRDSHEVLAEWEKYVSKIDKQVEDALRLCVRRSLQELIRSINFDLQTDSHPLFRVAVVLDESKQKMY